MKKDIHLSLKSSYYHIDSEWLDSLKEWDGIILVIGGVSGVGKTTITEALNIPSPRSITSRERKKEKESYDFVSTVDFDTFEKERAFSTVTSYPSGKFGLLKDRWDDLASKHRIILLGMNPLSYRLLKEAYPKTFGIFITASFDVVMERLMKRDGELDEIRVASYENNHRSQPFYHITYENTKSIRRAKWSIRWQILKFRIISHLFKEKGIEKYFPTQKSNPVRSHEKKRRDAGKSIKPINH